MYFHKREAQFLRDPSHKHTYIYVTLSMFYLPKRRQNGAVDQFRAICVYPHSLTSEAVPPVILPYTSAVNYPREDTHCKLRRPLILNDR
jgi:hypothetical protein